VPVGDASGLDEAGSAARICSLVKIVEPATS